jgi:hypothetical protein
MTPLAIVQELLIGFCSKDEKLEAVQEKDFNHKQAIKKRRLKINDSNKRSHCRSP